MPGILPMKVTLGSCEHCRNQNLKCDSGRPKCLNCTVAGSECKRSSQTIIAQACDHCRSKKIRCDGIRPSCTQCANVGFACKFSDKLSSRRAFPRGYTESLEERVRRLEGERKELKDLSDEKDERIESLIGSIAEARAKQEVERTTRKQNAHNILEPAQISGSATKHLHVYMFGVEKARVDARVHANKKSERKAKVAEWIEEKTAVARTTTATPAVNLLVIETPDDPPGEERMSRGLYEEVKHLSKPALDALGIENTVLGIFATAVFEKSAPDVANFNILEPRSAHDFTYHIAIGHFSLAFRYFPQSRSSIGILLVQNDKDVAAELLRDLITHQDLVGEPLLLPFLAQKSMAKLVSWWLAQHKEVIIDAQAQTGYHHMVSVRKSAELMDYTQLSATISGNAFNIATNELCWKLLAEHADLMAEELRTELNSPYVDRESGTDYTAKRFIEQHVLQMARHARAKGHEAESWQKKSSILTQGIFNLIAQQDQNTSIGIARDSKTLAEESKRDSTSMKVIAIVTMTYLPGTFAASLFSMNMFKWDAVNGEKVVSPWFWVYWAVTLPLVLVTFLVWVVWMRYQRVG